MAAYAAIVSALRAIEEIQLLHHYIYSKFPLRRKRQMKSLRDHLISLQNLLDEFPDKFSNLEGKLGDIVNLAGDLVEDLMLGEVRSPYISENGRISSPFSKFQQLERVLEAIGSIAKEATDIKKNNIRHINEKLATSSFKATSTSRFSSADKKIIVGLDDDMISIKERLCGESFKLQVLPIFGMGGIGKTTLANSIYVDPLIMESFDCRASVTIPQDYSFRDILLKLVGSFEKSGKKSGQDVPENLLRRSDAEIAQYFYQSLKGRKYLIFLDDIWSQKTWESMKWLFPDDNNRSRIMITTRLVDVAAYAVGSSSRSLHRMRFLDADQSWNLLRKKVDSLAQGSCPHGLESIGMEVAKRCRGLPLTVVVVAGILNNIRQTEAAWEEIARKLNATVVENGDQQVANVLSLSYRHLPHYLRPCFLYMSIFPEGQEERATNLFRMWTAEGFLKPSGSKSFEEIAEEYLEDLVKRSLILVTKRKPNGKIRKCSLHDLLRDMCLKRAQEEKFMLFAEDRNQRLKNQWRISTNHLHGRFHEKFVGSTTIRSIASFNRFGDDERDGFPAAKFLRVFYAPNLMFREFPPSVLHLFHLRYLSLHFNILDLHIPYEIFKLKKLQTFIISWTAYLPPTIWRMLQLRHLVSPHLHFFSFPSSDTRTLENLQTLATVNDFVCAKPIANFIQNVRKLGLRYTGSKLDWSKYQLENLVRLGKLETLEVTAGFATKCWSDLSENLALPSTLRRFSLQGCRLSWNALSIVGSLPNLEVLIIKYKGCCGCIWETEEGQFPRLKKLRIEETDLAQWITESSHFPRLERLTLKWCKELLELPDELGEIPTLQLLEMIDCTESAEASAKRIHSEQRDNGNETLHIVSMADKDNMRVPSYNNNVPSYNNNWRRSPCSSDSEDSNLCRIM